MLGIEKIILKPKYIKKNGLYVLDIENISFPASYIVKEKQLVSIPPGVTAGEHKHPRREAFVALSEELILIWLDEDGHKQQEKMKDGSNLKLIIMGANVPHAVVNRGKYAAVLLEFANDIQHEVTKMKFV